MGYVSVVECPEQREIAEKAAAELKRKAAIQEESLAVCIFKDYTEAKPEEYSLIPSPATGKLGS